MRPVFVVSQATVSRATALCEIEARVADALGIGVGEHATSATPTDQAVEDTASVNADPVNQDLVCGAAKGFNLAVHTGISLLTQASVQGAHSVGIAELHVPWRLEAGLRAAVKVAPNIGFIAYTLPAQQGILPALPCATADRLGQAARRILHDAALAHAVAV